MQAKRKKGDNPQRGAQTRSPRSRPRIACPRNRDIARAATPSARPSTDEAHVTLREPVVDLAGESSHDAKRAFWQAFASIASDLMDEGDLVIVHEWPEDTAA